MSSIVDLVCRQIAYFVAWRMCYDSGDHAGNLVDKLSRVAYHNYLDFLNGWVDPEEGPNDECT